MKTRAPTARIRFSRNQCRIRFITNTTADSTIIGVEQYIIRHRVCIRPLF